MVRTEDLVVASTDGVVLGLGGYCFRFDWKIPFSWQWEDTGAEEERYVAPLANVLANRMKGDLSRAFVVGALALG